MLQLPNIPTDNLYKFMAIAGLLIIFASFLIFITFITKLEEDTNSLSLQVNILKINIKYIDENHKRITEILNILEHTGQAEYIKESKKNKTRLIYSLKYSDDEIMELQQQF